MNSWIGIIYLLTHSLIHPLIHSFIHLFIHPIIHPIFIEFLFYSRYWDILWENKDEKVLVFKEMPQKSTTMPYLLKRLGFCISNLWKIAHVFPRTPHIEYSPFSHWLFKSHQFFQKSFQIILCYEVFPKLLNCLWYVIWLLIGYWISKTHNVLDGYMS